MSGTTSGGMSLRSARLARGLLQEELAARAGVGIATVSRLDRGDLSKKPTNRTFTKILSALASIQKFTDNELLQIFVEYDLLPFETRTRRESTGATHFSEGDRKRLLDKGLLISVADEVIQETAQRFESDRIDLPDRSREPGRYAAVLPYHLLERLIASIGPERTTDLLRTHLSILGAASTADEDRQRIMRKALPPRPGADTRDDPDAEPGADLEAAVERLNQIDQDTLRHVMDMINERRKAEPQQSQQHA